MATITSGRLKAASCLDAEAPRTDESLEKPVFTGTYIGNELAELKAKKRQKCSLLH